MKTFKKEIILTVRVCAETEEEADKLAQACLMQETQDLRLDDHNIVVLGALALPITDRDVLEELGEMNLGEQDKSDSLTAQHLSDMIDIIKKVFDSR